MSGVKFLCDGPRDAQTTLVLAHGAGAPMDSPFMAGIAEGLAQKGQRVLRFEFAYMSRRREDGVKRPPAAQKILEAEWHAVIEELRSARPDGRLVIGGKSMGGRMASLVADATGVDGLICLGYPFHPPGKPEKLRTAHLASLVTPALIVQGTRDPFGTREEVSNYCLSDKISFHWAEDGDHGFKPRKASGMTEAGNIELAITAIGRFLATVAAARPAA